MVIGNVTEKSVTEVGAEKETAATETVMAIGKGHRRARRSRPRHVTGTEIAVTETATERRIGTATESGSETKIPNGRRTGIASETRGETGERTNTGKRNLRSAVTQTRGESAVAP